MKNTLKVINYVLLGLALVAVGFGVFAFFQYRAVPIAEYESSAADLRAQAQLVDESTDKLSEDMKAQQDALREDISQGGDEGKTLASELAAAERSLHWRRWRVKRVNRLPVRPLTAIARGPVHSRGRREPS